MPRHFYKKTSAMPRRRRATLAFIIILLAPALALAQQGNSVRGKVRDAAGNVVPRVIVDLQTGNGAPVGQTTTNNEGDFFFGGLQEAGYTVIVKSPGYNTASEAVEFSRRVGENTPGETRAVEITLTPLANAVAPRAAPGRVTLAQVVPARAREAFERGMKLSREGKSEEAVAAVRESIELFPDYFDAHFWLANELIRTGRLDDAVQHLEVARRVSPKDERVYLSFGQLLMLKRNYGVAAAVFAEAARLNPTDPQTHMQRGVALVEYATVINASASQRAAEERRVALEDAERALNEAYRVSGKRLSAVHLQLARVYEKRGERARAADELEQYLRENPSEKNADAMREAVKTLRAPKP
jgi:tetratricopeptide (TPR) repeat protein